MPSPKLEAVPGSLPEPPYPDDIKCNGWSPLFDIARIDTSETWTLAEDDERPWLLRVWYEAWRSVPVGSMPADRRLFARRIGCKVAFLDAHAEILLRGWALHADGNLYHPVISDMVLGMLAKRHGAAERKRRSRENVTRDNGDVTRESRGVTQESHTGRERKGKEEKKTPLSPPKGGKATGTRFDIETMPDSWRAFAEANTPGIDPAATFAKFADYWRAVPGARGRKADWLATWRNWCRREQEGKSNADSRTARGESRTERNIRLQQEAERRAIDAWHSSGMD